MKSGDITESADSADTPGHGRGSSEPATQTGSNAARRACRSKRAIALFLGITLVIFAADQGLKYFAFQTSVIAGEPVQVNRADPAQTLIPRHQPLPVVDSVLSLRLLVNEGAVFGLGDGWQWLFILVSIVAAGVIIRLFWVSPANAYLTHFALALILAGDLGNLYDRLVFNAVRDMLLLFPGMPLPFGLSWPNGERQVWPWVFNVADAALMAGIFLVLVITWRNEQRRPAGRSARS